MFATATDVKSVTGKIVTNDLIQRAQYVIEAFVGKFEAEVTDTKDIEIMKRAVSYQSAYMLNNEDIVYEQMKISTSGQSDSYTSFRAGDDLSPFIAPMAVIICAKLSFMKNRSVYTGKSSDTVSEVDWRTV